MPVRFLLGVLVEPSSHSVAHSTLCAMRRGGGNAPHGKRRAVTRPMRGPPHPELRQCRCDHKGIGQRDFSLSLKSQCAAMVRKLRRTVAVAEQGTVSTLCSARVRLWHKGESFGTTA